MVQQAINNFNGNKKSLWEKKINSPQAKRKLTNFFLTRKLEVLCERPPVNHRRSPGDEIWYKQTPLGKNEIGKFLSLAAKKASIQQGVGSKISNHYVRKTGISRLLDAGVPENFVAQLSGHKSTESLKSYKTAGEKHQQEMSFTLSRSAVERPSATATILLSIKTFSMSRYSPVLWEDAINKVNVGKTYHFKNLRVRIFYDAKFLNTNEFTIIELIEDMPDVNFNTPKMQDKILTGRIISALIKRSSSCIVCNESLKDINEEVEIT
ncbi:predicted protein [Nematostella vectensis]|uniref:Tyr recombinase domain-containing protein n=1 Tax=Nematostella vectensis TaxID=45351 RepID=A7SB12_NEMVE|nr:predicted protein [Nematostella vectensis]|eukprot:XP_001631162.1 predicted protein [Nematostella vectensis]